jgi:GrpB-like predicted nucleotidyltransferase (UPF0157 family)
MARQPKKEWLTEREAAEFLGIRLSLLTAWRKRGILPVRPNPAGRGVLYNAQELQRIKELADKLAQLGIPSPVNAAVHGRVPVKWLTQLLGISRQRIYQLVPGSLTWENALALLERRINRNPTLKSIYQPLKRWLSGTATGQGRQRQGAKSTATKRSR